MVMRKSKIVELRTYARFANRTHAALQAAT